MKKLNILLISAASLLAGGITTSCSDDFLDIVPAYNYTLETFYSSDDAVMKATEPLYGYAWFNYNYRAMIGMGSVRANDGWNPYLNPEFSTFQVTGLSPEVQNAWESFYTVVTMSNQLMSDINNYCTDDVSLEVKNLALGEAHLMRGVAYFYLVRSWGDAIIIEDNEAVVKNPVQPLAPEEDVLKFAVNDFRKAVDLLPVGSKNNHATKTVAKAFLAKALLAQSGWNKRERDIETLKKVDTLCIEVLADDRYGLMENYEDLFTYENNNFTMQNKETLLAMRFGDPLTAGWLEKSACFSDLAWSGSSDITCWGGIYASVDMLDLFNEDTNDVKRFHATWCSPGAYYSYWDTNNDLVSADEKTKENGYPAPTGYVYKKKFCQLKKYVCGTQADCNGHLAQMASPLNTYLMRLADVYLILAESRLRNADATEDPVGRDALNAVRRRAGVSTFGDGDKYTLEDIIKERRKEFCMEFVNWFDMVTWYRWKPQYMLDYFNNKQHRAFMINEGDVLYNPDGSISYCTFPQRQDSPWYFINYDDQETYPDGLRYWNDCLRVHNSEEVVMTKKDGYVYDVDKLSRACPGYDPVTLNESNIFLPYPEKDVLNNPLLKEKPVPYNFGDEKQDGKKEK